MGDQYTFDVLVMISMIEFQAGGKCWYFEVLDWLSADIFRRGRRRYWSEASALGNNSDHIS